MFRRTFFKSVFSSLALQFFPAWAQSGSVRALATDALSLNDLALIVLPASLGAARIAEITAAFQRWIAGYHAGADAGYTYGNSRLRVLGPNPSRNYAEQIAQIETVAMGRGAHFTELDAEGKRAVIRSVLAAANANTVPSHPNGAHVLTDLMSYFYTSSDGMDFCYNAAIRRADCRGLASSGNRPAPLS